jgi:hypothetical protein
MSMTMISFLFTVAELALKHGIPAAIKIVNGWQDAGNTPTAESFETLRNNHRAPEEFLTPAQRSVLGIAKK